MSRFSSPVTCAEFEAAVSEYVDGALSVSERSAIDSHKAHCKACVGLERDIRAIVHEAASLPALSPSRDLWSGIASQLDTPVVSIGTTGAHPVAARKRSISFRQFAAAAALIIAASSGVTYMLTRANPASTSPTVATATTVATTGAAATGVTPAVTALPATQTDSVSQTVASVTAAPVSETPARRNTDAAPATRSRYASTDGSTEFVYEREIAAMRKIVDERLGDLDSATVAEIERNLNIIDKAISDSRRALQNDPRSRFLSSQLDRALENKLGVLRRIALL